LPARVLVMGNLHAVVIAKKESKAWASEAVKQ
jgi:hypothetical protein